MSTEGSDPTRKNRLAKALVEYHDHGQSFDQERFLSRYGDIAEDLLIHLDMDSKILRMLPAPIANDCATPPAPRPPIVEFGDYELLEKISHGGMGVVYKARHKKLHRISAIKRPLPGLAEDPVDRERFLREARAAAGLRHPNICPIHVVGENNGQPYIEMDFISGKTLSAWARETKPSPRESAEIVAQLARAVGYAHDHGVIHRDIKPRNVIVDAEMQTPVLMDFGLARNLSDSDTRLTRSGQVLGTPAYMSPEQAAGNTDQAGPLSDVYSVGAVLYELLCGQPPFSCGLTQFLREVQIREPRSPRKVNPNVHRDLETICVKAMTKEPSRRYASALALAEDLDRFLAGEPIQARPVGPLGRASRWIRRRPSLAAAVGVMVLSALAVFWQQGTILSLIVKQRIQENRMEQVSGGAAAAEYAKLVADVRNWLQRPVLGQKQAMIDRLIRASQINTPARNTRELRNLATACLATVDLANPRVLTEDYEGRRLAFSADGKRLAIGKYKGIIQCSVRVVEVETGHAKDFLFPSTLKTRDTGVGGVSFSPDGRLLVAGTRDGYIHVWDTSQDGSWPTTSFKAHDAAINGLAFRPDGQLLVSVSKDTTLKRWNPSSWKEVDCFKDTGGLTAVTYNTIDGSLIYTGETGVHWLDSTGESPAFDQVETVCTSPVAPLLVAGRPEQIALFDTLRREMIVMLEGSEFASAHQAQIHSLDIAPDGSLLVSASSDRMVYIWDLARRRKICTIRAPGGGAVAAAFSPNGKRMAVLTGEQVVLYEIDGLVERTQLAPQAHPIGKFAFASDGKTLATVAPWKRTDELGRITLSLWHVWNGRHSTTYDLRFSSFRVETSAPPSVAWAPDGMYLACGYQTEVHLLRLSDGLPSICTTTSAHDVECLCFGPDGRSLWVAHDRQLTRFTIPDLAISASWQDYVSTIVSARRSMVCVDAGQRWTVAGNRDGMVRLLEMRGKQIVRRQQWPSGTRTQPAVSSVAISRDETLAASGNETGTVQVVELPSARVVLEQKAHADSVNSVVFSPDGLLLATGSKDGTARVWIRHGGSFEQVLTIHAQEPVFWMQFSIDGNCLAILAENELAVRVWHIDRLRKRLWAMGLDWGTPQP